MLRAVARSALKLVPGAHEAVTLSASRSMSVEGMKGFKENEKVIEDMYFTKEDQRILGKLLNKVKSQSDVVDKHAAEGMKSAELSALKPIVEKYKIDRDDVQKLLAWKHTQY